MILVTSPNVPGKKIVQTLGLVKGNTIRARHIGKDILAVFKNIVGGEIHEYTKLMAESREQAIDRMKESAEQIGANAVISVCSTTAMISQGAAELMVLGTAVIIEDSKIYFLKKGFINFFLSLNQLSVLCHQNLYH